MDINVAHEVQKNRQGKIEYRRFRRDGYAHYKVRLYLKGDDISKVSYVEYELHPTFSNRTRTVESSNDHFSLYIWTWGEFDVVVTVFMKDGEKKSIIHPLEYSDMLPLSENEYVDESPDSYREE